MARIPSGEEILGGVMAVASLAIAALHGLGLLEPMWAREQVPIVTLVVAGLVAGYLGLGTTRDLDRLGNKLDGLSVQIDSTLGGTVRRFDDIGTLSAHVRARMKSAREVADLTWGPAIQRPNPAHKGAYAKYRSEITEFGSKQKVVYREVMTFPDVERVALAEDVLSRNLPSYQLRYFDTSSCKAPPPVRFISIDDEVIFVQHRKAALPTEGVVWVSVTNPAIVELAKVYFAEVWEAALPVDQNVIQRARAALTIPTSGV